MLTSELPLLLSLASLLVLYFILTTFFDTVIEPWLYRVRYRNEDEDNEAPYNLLPWIIVSEEIDLFNEVCRDYILDAIESFGTYKQRRDVRFMFQQLDALTDSKDAQPDTLFACRIALRAYLREIWPL